MKKTIRICVFLQLFSITIYTQAPYGSAGQHTAVRLDQATDNPPFGFYEYLPLDFGSSSGDVYPLVLFYHGIGEKGNGSEDLQRVLVHGPPRLIEQGLNFDAIVISPQDQFGFFNGDSFLRLYNYLIAHYPIDSNRIYVTGLSAGGGGTWKSAEAHPDKIAAIVPICGANTVGDPSDFLQHMPIWAHHNFEDRIVGRGTTITNVNRIANNGSNVNSVYPFGPNTTVADTDYTMQYDTINQQWSTEPGVVSPKDKMSFTLYKFGGHNAWTKTYTNPVVWDWMFAQQLTNTLAVNEIEIQDPKQVMLYPNPSHDILHIKTTQAIRSISLHDSAGRQVLSVNDTQKIDVRELHPGLYMLRIKHTSGAVVTKSVLKK